MRKTEILIPILMMLSSCSWMNQEVGLEDDNIIEELFEAAIDVKTGLDLDLTPTSPEYNTKTLSPTPSQPHVKHELPPFKLGE